MNNDFKDHPQSIGEIKSFKSQDGKDWTPRECLVAMLREIDNGFDIDTLIICLSYKKDDKSRFRFSQSTQDGLKSLGLLENIKIMMIMDE